MIHRRTVLAIVVFLTLAFAVFSTQDSFAGPSSEKRFVPTRGEGVASSRLDGSVLPTSGDPDEPSTWKRHTTGDGTVPLGGSHWGDRSGVHFKFESRRAFLSFVWMYLRSHGVGVF